MTIILNQCNEAKRAEIALGSSYEDNLEAGELIKFLARVCTVCNDTNNANTFFGSSVTKQNYQTLFSTNTNCQRTSIGTSDQRCYLGYNTNQCNVSFDTVDDTEVTTSIHITKESTVTTTISMSNNDDEPWLDAHEEFDLWYDTPETMDNYKKRDKPPNILKDTSIINESPNKHIDPDFYISKCQT